MEKQIGFVKSRLRHYVKQGIHSITNAGHSAEENCSLSFQKRHWDSELTRQGSSPEALALNWGDPEDRWDRLGPYHYFTEKYLIPRCTPDRVALDLGSWSGKYLPYLLQCKKVIACDLFDSSFLYIKEKFGSHPNFAKLEFYQTKGDELSGLEAGSVDFIFSMDSLSRAPRQAIFSYIREFGRILSPQGKLCVFFPCNSRYMSCERGFTNLSFSDLQEQIYEHLPKAKIKQDLFWHGVVALI